MWQLIEPDTFSKMKIMQRFSLPDKKYFFDTCSSRQWNISWGCFQVLKQASLKFHPPKQTIFMLGKVIIQTKVCFF